MLMPISFCNEDADLILRCEDGVQLRVYKCILSEASPFFNAMFSLPQPRNDRDRRRTCTSSPPIIDVPESSENISTVLQFVYPYESPSITSLDELSSVLATAMKYELVSAIQRLRHQLLSPRFLELDPVRVFAIACRYDFDEEARTASGHCLRINLLDECPLSTDFKHVTAYSYHRLLDLHRRRSQAAQQLLKLEENVKCVQCSSSHYGHLFPPRWWVDFERRAKEELAVRPTSDVIFTMKFLLPSAHSGCQRCPESVLESHEFLDRLRKRIDDLPSTI